MRGLVALVLVGCSSAAIPTPRPHDRYEALTNLLARDPATGKPVDTIAELIPLLEPELRSSFTLVFATRSPEQDVDPLHPRVVLFGNDARLVLAFTGDPIGPDRDILELLHFRDDTRAFELERFVLPAAARRDPKLAELARDNGHANPNECSRCHSADPRPIFDSYPVWPGFYGSVQDAFAISPDELASYRAFLASRDGVYKLLEFLPGSEVSPYSIDPAEDPTGRLAPNMRLGMALTELNRKRIARKLEASPYYAKYRDKLLAGLLGCAPLPIAIEDRKRIEQQLSTEDAAKLDRARIDGPDQRDRLRMTEINSFDNFAEIEYMARILDVSRADWSMATEPGAFALYDGILSGRVVENNRARDFYFKEDFLFEMLRAEPVFATKPYSIYQRVGQRLDLPRAIAACQHYADRSKDVAWPAEPPVAPLVVYRCVRCHDPGGDGPPIPFDSPTRLRAMLTPQLADEIAARTLITAATRMPLDQPPLAKAERVELLSYIK